MGLDMKVSGEVVIPQNARVTVTRMNHITRVQHLEKHNDRSFIRKLDADTFLDLLTGEIREFNKTQNRGQNLKGLRRTFQRLGDLVNNNFVGGDNELHCILTYKENMKDVSRLRNDFEAFFKRFRRKYKELGRVEYISVIEPQRRGAWHYHLLLTFPESKKVFIPNETLARLWSHGFVKVLRLENVDNIGAYLTAYLVNVEAEGEVVADDTIKVAEVDGVPKAFVKGGRLHLYPPGVNLYRRTRGIELPSKRQMVFKEFLKEQKKVAGSGTPHYQVRKEIKDGDFENTIQILEYNSKRLNSP